MSYPENMSWKDKEDFPGSPVTKTAFSGSKKKKEEEEETKHKPFKVIWSISTLFLLILTFTLVQVHGVQAKEDWASKNWCFWAVVLEKTLESPLDSKEIKPVNPEGNQPWIFIGRMILKLQCCGHLMWRADSLEKTLMLEKIGGMRRSGWQRMRRLDDIIDSMDMSLSKIQELMKDRET